MLPIVDSHLHFLDLSRFDYPWLASADSSFLAGRDRYLPGDWRMDVGDLEVIAGVHVQAEVDHAIDPVAETAWLAQLAEPVAPMVHVAYADLRSPRLHDVLARHCDHERMRGIRQPAWFDPTSARADLPHTNVLLDHAWCAGLPALAEHGLSFDLFVWWHQLGQAAGVFGGLPELVVIVEHVGMPPLDDADGMRTWREGMSMMAEQVPNAVLKLSGLTEFEAGDSPGVVRELLHEVLELFGSERCMFGSNYPVDRTAAAYRRIWDLFDEVSSDLSEPERHALFAGTALRTYRIDVVG